MAGVQEAIRRAYAGFNRRAIEEVFALMREDVSWPKASEGGRAAGKDEIREYWTRQWAEFDPRVEPLEVKEPEAGKARVTVHQVVRDLHGEVLSDSVVTHVYSFVDGLIGRMDIEDGNFEAFRDSRGVD